MGMDFEKFKRCITQFYSGLEISQTAHIK